MTCVRADPSTLTECKHLKIEPWASNHHSVLQNYGQKQQLSYDIAADKMNVHVQRDALCSILSNKTHQGSNDSCFEDRPLIIDRCETTVTTKSCTDVVSPHARVRKRTRSHQPLWRNKTSVTNRKNATSPKRPETQPVTRSWISEARVVLRLNASLEVNHVNRNGLPREFSSKAVRSA